MFQWTPCGDPEGVMNLKKAFRLCGNKLVCKDCKKVFRFTSYYQTHLPWCGREVCFPPYFLCS